MNIIKIPGFDLCSLGMTERPDDKTYEEIIFIDKAKRYYKKCVIHRDRLVGAILIGDKNEFQEFKELIAGKLELSEKRLQLLRSGKKTEPVLGKLVCSCNNVGSENLKKAIAGRRRYIGRIVFCYRCGNRLWFVQARGETPAGILRTKSIVVS
jgi:ferredoxin-nitrate reductase